MEQDDSLAEKLIALGDLSILADVSMPREKLLTLFTSKIHTLFGARAVAVWLANPEDHSITLHFQHGFSSNCSQITSQALPASSFPEVSFAIDSGTVWTTEDIVDSGLYTSEETQCLIKDLEINAVMGVPLRALKEKLGAISFYYSQARQFNANEKALALAYANALALSLNNIDSYSQLAASERMKSEIVSIVAHQFRTPIAVLRGNVELLKGEKSCSQTGQSGIFISEIEKVGEKLKMFVESFLSVKAIDEGRLEPRLVAVDLPGTVQESITNLEAYRAKHNIVLNTNIEGKDKQLQVLADQVLIGEAIYNVVSNAIKYAKSSVEITIEKQEKEALLTVQDDGVGIPKKEQPQIFQKLFRASNVARHPEASSGLGLYIAQQYLKKQGGRIWFESLGEDQGTTFYISLPLAK